jgi:hypothetical protein
MRIYLISLLLLPIYCLSQNINDFSTYRSSAYSNAAYQVCKAICPNTGYGYKCLRISDLTKNNDGTYRGWFYFKWDGQTNSFAPTVPMYVLLEIDVTGDGSLDYIHSGYIDDDAYKALNVRYLIDEETEWGEKIREKTKRTDYISVQQYAINKYSY